MATSFNLRCVNENTSEDIDVMPSARLFMCGRCHAQTMVCSCCDQGNVYCLECQTIARKEARQRTAKRYQQSRIGRSKHAERQARYRERQRASEIKVTHQGSTASVTVVSAPDRPNVAEQGGKMLVYQDLNSIVCDFCREVCSTFLRRNFYAQPC